MRLDEFLEHLAAEGWIQPDEKVVVFNTGAAQKYPEAMAVSLPRLQKGAAINWQQIRGDGSTAR